MIDAVPMGAHIGMLAGVHAASWGAYKDSVYEGFSCWKYARSVLIATAAGALLAPVLQCRLADSGSLLVLFGCVYVTERGTFEAYKTFVRQEDQSKYHIPMQFHVLGRIIESRLARAVAGMLFLAGIGAVMFAVASLERASGGVPHLAMAALVGAVAGSTSAVMGAWKDAPIEGFETLKFLRSPAIGMCYGVLLAPFARDLIPLGVAALGFTIASIETWKTFLDGRPPGKFAGKAMRYPVMLRARWRLVPVFAAIWIAVAAAAFSAWRGESARRALAVREAP